MKNKKIRVWICRALDLLLIKPAYALALLALALGCLVASGIQAIVDGSKGKEKGRTTKARPAGLKMLVIGCAPRLPPDVFAFINFPTTGLEYPPINPSDTTPYRENKQGGEIHRINQDRPENPTDYVFHGAPTFTLSR